MDSSTIKFLVSTGVSLIEILVAFAGIWMGMVFITIEMSGWRLLSRKFKANDKPDGRSFYNQVYRMGSSAIISNRGSMGWVHLAVSPHGLYLAVICLPRVYSPLLIPWSSITKVVHGRAWDQHWYRLDIDGVTSVRVGAYAFEAMRTYVPTPVDLAA